MAKSKAKSSRQQKSASPPKRLRVSSAESREKARQRQAKYRSKPETRQKEAGYLVERRATIKAKRRQWDPPKQKPIEAPAESLTGSDRPGLTLSGLDLLADLATTLEPIIRPSSSYWESLWSDTKESSCDAVLNASVLEPRKEEVFLEEPLPRYCSPTTPSQRRNWHLIGKVGPLSGVQRAQLMVMNLAEPREFDEEPLARVQWKISGRMRPKMETMSSERWESVRAWRHSVDTDYEYSGAEDEEERQRVEEEERQRVEEEERQRVEEEAAQHQEGVDQEPVDHDLS
ncbi:hypothetical protein R3P38DRAFT_3210458 [Favolaschia claudopus]|uniref:Uncharacterized protein n=1 Tax=Favolaschia claudopus TaxID=2862362 RepID=A0AAW0AGY8_9AGAR